MISDLELESVPVCYSNVDLQTTVNVPVKIFSEPVEEALYDLQDSVLLKL